MPTKTLAKVGKKLSGGKYFPVYSNTFNFQVMQSKCYCSKMFCCTLKMKLIYMLTQHAADWQTEFLRTDLACHHTQRESYHRSVQSSSPASQKNIKNLIRCESNYMYFTKDSLYCGLYRVRQYMRCV